jgi:CheY-like chemotaxis protein
VPGPFLEVLVADDDPVSRTVVAAMVRKAGFAVTLANDGKAAWTALSADPAPTLALLDWEMPGLDGPEVLRRVRERATATPTYVILLTSRVATADIVAGLKAGANDYITKPANHEELLARLGVGARVVELQQALADRVRRLEEALANVRTLQGLLPICSYCKAIRNDKNYWEKVETYFSDHSGVQFSHSYCPACYVRFVKPQLDALDDLGPARGR